MIKWIKTWWRPERIIIRPESATLGQVSPKDLAAMWPEIAQAYDKHATIMAFVKWMLQKQEAKINQPAPLNGDAKEEAEWLAVKKDALSKADALRSVLYAPRLASLMLEQESRKKADEVEQSPEDYFKNQPFIPS